MTVARDTLCAARLRVRSLAAATWRGRDSAASSSASTIASMNSRTRSRTPISIGSNQLSKSSTVASAAGCAETGFVTLLPMAWSPARRPNAGDLRLITPETMPLSIPTNFRTAPPIAAGTNPCGVT